MRWLAPLAAALVLASGCMFVFDGGGEGGDGGGDISGDDDVCEPQPALRIDLRDPESLGCATFFGCDEICGPCPLFSLPPPPWGTCSDPCHQLDQAACEADASCRVARSAACAVAGTCELDFLGCFPVNRFSQLEQDCFAARTGEECADGLGCTGYYDVDLDAPGRPRQFAMCAPEGELPGTCFAEVTCASAAPSCPSGTRPGVANGCYTGACIPTSVCEPAPL